MNGEILKSSLAAEKAYVEEKAMRPKGFIGSQGSGGHYWDQFSVHQ
jgi:hypothetical protein